MLSRYTQKTKDFTTERRNLGILNFDTDNLYPFHTENMSMNCGILGTCQDIFSKFIYGGGFPLDIWKRKINKFDNIDKFFRKLINDYSKHNGFAFHIRYNALLDPIEYSVIPFETLRLKFPDENKNINKIYYSQDWYNSRKTPEMIEYDLYTDDKEVIYKQIENAGGIEKWRGQVFYFGNNGNVEYPINSFHSVIEDVVTDIQVKKGKNSMAMTNFLAGYVIEIPTDSKNIATEQGTTTADTKAEFLNSLQEVQGMDNIGKFILVENDSRDVDGKSREIKFHKLDLQNYDKVFEYVETTCQSAIRRKYLIPEIFINPVSTGFSTEIMNDLYHYYNQVTKQERQIFEEVAMQFLPAIIGQQTDLSFTPLTYKEVANG